MPLQFKSFTRPDLLKTIHPKNLASLLEPHRRFLEDRGFCLPAGTEHELDCLTLAGILAQPDEEMPSDLVEALSVIECFSDAQHFDDLLALAEAAGLEVGEEETAVDAQAQADSVPPPPADRFAAGKRSRVDPDADPLPPAPRRRADPLGFDLRTEFYRIFGIDLTGEASARTSTAR